MSKILAGIFLGVFVSALAYEMLERSNPELLKKVREKISGKLDEFLETGEIEEPEN